MIFQNHLICISYQIQIYHISVIKSVTKLTTMNNYYLRDDGSKLLLEKSPETRSKPSTHLKVYSNNQLWVIGKNNKEQCLHVDHKEHLNSLDGIDVKLADKEEGILLYFLQTIWGKISGHAEARYTKQRVGHCT